MGVTIGNKLNFETHVSELCITASAQLNAPFRFNYVLSFKAFVLVQNFIYANFNYCGWCNFNESFIGFRLRPSCFNNC